MRACLLLIKDFSTIGKQLCPGNFPRLVCLSLNFIIAFQKIALISEPFHKFHSLSINHGSVEMMLEMYFFFHHCNWVSI